MKHIFKARLDTVSETTLSDGIAESARLTVPAIGLELDAQ